MHRPRKCSRNASPSKPDSCKKAFLLETLTGNDEVIFSALGGDHDYDIGPASETAFEHSYQAYIVTRCTIHFAVLWFVNIIFGVNAVSRVRSATDLQVMGEKDLSVLSTTGRCFGVGPLAIRHTIFYYVSTTEKRQKLLQCKFFTQQAANKCGCTLCLEKASHLYNLL